MRRLFIVDKYEFLIWPDNPEECVNVIIRKSQDSRSTTKLWVTSSGKAVVCHNNSELTAKMLNKLIIVVEANHSYIVYEWSTELWKAPKYFM